MSETKPANPPMPEPLEDGTTLIYAIGDSGQDFPAIGLFLEPGVPLTVGEDIEGVMAARMVKRGTLKIVPAEKPSSDAVTETIPAVPANIETPKPMFASTVGEAAPGPPPVVVEAASTDAPTSGE